MKEYRKYIAPLLSASLLALALLSIFFFPYTSSELFKVWRSPEYSHAPLVIPIIIYLLYKNRSSLEKAGLGNNWGGLAVIILGLFSLVLANYANFWILHGYGYLMVLSGAFYVVFGPKWMRANWQVFLLVFLALPFPTILYKNFSLALQGMATTLGVNIISLLGGSVYRSGNIIDLGDVKLQVVDACSGLRYIIPLISLSVIYAFFYKGGLLSKILLILSSIPIAVIVNGIRVGLMGVGVEYFDMNVSEGVEHDLEGGVMFLMALVLLLLIGVLLEKVFSNEYYKKSHPEERKPRDSGIRIGRDVASILIQKRIGGVLAALGMFSVIIGYNAILTSHVEVIGEGGV